MNRDKRTEGNSVEVIFQRLQRRVERACKLIEFKYDLSAGVIQNATRLRKIKASVFHITAGVYHLTFFIPTRKTVLTIHDIGRYKEMGGLKKLVYGLFFLRVPMMLAKRITTVSTYTKTDILEHFGQRFGSKLHIIPNSTPGIFKRMDKQFNSERPTVLQIGTGINKNLDSIVRAIADSHYRLVIIGRLSDTQRELLNTNEIDYQNYYALTYEEVYKCYCEADIVAFVSLHEGFGMPVIEGQAVGRVVVTSAECSLPEVGGNGAHYIENPLDIVEIRAAIDKVAQDSEYRRELIERGFENINRFNPETIAQSYLSLYEELVG